MPLVDEDTFYTWQRRGTNTVAAALRERDAIAGGAVPGDDASARQRRDLGSSSCGLLLFGKGILRYGTQAKEAYQAGSTDHRG